MHHQDIAQLQGQRAVAQPIQQWVAVICFEDGGERIGLGSRLAAACYRQQVQVMVAQQGSGTPGLRQPVGQAQRRQRIGAAVDQVAHKDDLRARRHLVDALDQQFCLVYLVI